MQRWEIAVLVILVLLVAGALNLALPAPAPLPRRESRPASFPVGVWRVEYRTSDEEPYALTLRPCRSFELRHLKDGYFYVGTWSIESRCRGAFLNLDYGDGQVAKFYAEGGKFVLPGGVFERVE